MADIHLTQDLQSDTLPELRPLIGKRVEIIVRDLSHQLVRTDPWEALQALVGQDLIDPDAYNELRELDRNQQVG